MSYGGLAFETNIETPHVGGSISIGDPFTFAPSVWSYLIDRFCVASLLDLGSGSGNAAEYFARKGVRVVAIDGLLASVEKSVHPAVYHDLTVGPVKTRVDIVHCQEVAEHIEEKYSGNLIESLLCGRFIVLTHALPGQGGHHHVNLQPPEYWIDRMSAAGCVLIQEDTDRVRTLAKSDGATFLAATGLVFHNQARG